MNTGLARARFIVYAGEPVVYEKRPDPEFEANDGQIDVPLCRCDEVRQASWIAEQLNALESITELLVRLGWALDRHTPVAEATEDEG